MWEGFGGGAPTPRSEHVHFEYDYLGWRAIRRHRLWAWERVGSSHTIANFHPVFNEIEKYCFEQWGSSGWFSPYAIHADEGFVDFFSKPDTVLLKLALSG